MKNEFRLALFGHIFDLQLKLAKELVDTRFRAPLKEFLLNQPAKDRRDGFEVGNLVKAYIQEDRPKDELDAQKIQEDMASGIAAGDFTLSQIKDLVANGVLGVTNFEKAGEELVTRGKAAGYTNRLPGGGRPALKILVLDKGALDGVASAMKKDVDIADLISNSSGTNALHAAEKIIKAGMVALQRP